ncbi:MAG: MBOAT family protein [Deltaproteobacteria bacterium]|jgi:D-alanyl-lipoteichoic acid acyltransferase DltB (MBOAT superfamily)|nr:MBOAT family protein [Deltaproteobacteria bacterium]
MPFTSLDFAIFFGAVLCLNWLVKSREGLYRPFLLAASIAFYAFGAPKFVPLLAAVSLLNWQTVRLMDQKPAFRKAILAADITANLGLLIFFKYFEFLLSSLESLGLIPPAGLLALPEIVYPVGLSFFTFQGLSLAIDQYRSPDPEPPSLLDTMVFVTFFPTVLSGPIQRYSTFQAQLAVTRPNPAAFSLALYLILAGLFKKVALSSYLSEQIVRGVFQVPESYSALGVLAGIYGYSAQIYLDFSGYSDLAQGIGLLLGLDAGQNFRSPYLTSNVRDFWRRWHISLSSWLKDYLYIPLGGSRRGSQTLNLLLTQTLGGLWHGAHLRYLVWGLAHGLALAGTHLYFKFTGRSALLKEAAPRRPAPRREKLKKWGGFLLTINFVSFTWILFRAENLDRASEIARSALDWSRPGDGAPLLVWLIVLLTLAGQKYGSRIQKLFLTVHRRLAWPALALWFAFWVIVILKLGPEGVLPFIYFQY